MARLFSNESGRDQVYVRPFPGPGSRSLISTGGGVFPTWSQTKHELFYATVNGQTMVAPYRLERDAFIVGKPRPWSEKRVFMRGRGSRMFDLHRDGDRLAFAPVAQTVGAKRDHLTFIFTLRRTTPHCADDKALSLQPDPTATSRYEPEKLDGTDR